MAAPLVSVVIPTYRRASFLADTVASALGQTFRDIELIVVEDGSHEAEHVLAPFAGRYRYHWQENRGVGGARNAGARLARGRWLAFLDDDDCWEPTPIDRQLAPTNAHPAAALVQPTTWCY